MQLLSLIFKKNKKKTWFTSSDKDHITDIKNWYSDRYQYTIIQRNLLFLVCVIALAVILALSIAVEKVVSTKSVEPFILTIEDGTNITNVVNPVDRTALTTNEALQRYFLVQYVNVRESYSPMDIEYKKNVVRLFSSGGVYSRYNMTMINDKNSPPNKYGVNNNLTVKIRSIQFLETGKLAQVRFAVTESEGAKQSFNKIATINFDYVAMELNMTERYINPLGFIINDYRVDDEIL
jgi:type IV secretion system protein VirB8